MRIRLQGPVILPPFSAVRKFLQLKKRISPFQFKNIPYIYTRVQFSLTLHFNELLGLEIVKHF